MIVFGIRHFKVKTYSAAEFGLTDPSWNATQFVAAQQYFHIMYIPFFPTGKFMATKGRDGKLYHLAPQIATHIKFFQLKHKTPWYTFIGPMFLLLMGIGTLISDSIRNHRYQQISIEENQAFVKQANEMLDKPSANDYYQFSIDTTGGKDGYVSRQVYAVYRVNSFDNNSIEFRTGDENPWTYCSNPEYAGWPALFTDSSFITFRISKADLRAMQSSASGEEYNSDGVKINLFGKPRYFKIENIHTIDGPEFSAYFREISEATTRVRVENSGDAVKNISLVNIKKDGDWSPDTNGDILPGGYFEFERKGNFSDNLSVRILCETADGKHYAFLLSSDEDHMISVKKIR
jgi:hypothetical protein